MTLVATPKAANANSYVTESEADAYFENRLHGDAWQTAENPEQALITATSMLDWYMEWAGTKTTSTQALEWPRSDVYDNSENLLDIDTIPVRIKNAVCELALFSLSADRVAENDIDGFSKLKVGPLSLESDSAMTRSSKKKPIPQHVFAMLSDFIMNGPGSKRLIRG